MRALSRRETDGSRCMSRRGFVGALGFSALAGVGLAAGCTPRAQAGGSGSLAYGSAARRASGSAEAEAAAEEEEVAGRASSRLAHFDLAAIPAAPELAAFALEGGAHATGAPSLTADATASIGAALATVQTMGSLSLVLLDTVTGAGVAYGTDTVVYGASSFKAPYAAYVLRELVETGAVSLDTGCIVSPNSWYDGTYGIVGATFTVRELIQALVLDSDNDAFRILHDNLDGLGYLSWADGLFGAGVIDPIAPFQNVSARTMARAWSYIWTYIETESTLATWLAQMLATTNRSFIRDALGIPAGTPPTAPLDAGTPAADAVALDATVQTETPLGSVRVWNKAGWVGGDVLYNSTSDAGVVQVGSTPYLVCAMSNMSYGDASAAALEAVISSALSGLVAAGQENSD